MFHYAVRAGSKTVIAQLLETKKIKDNNLFDVRDSNGETALYFAASLSGQKAINMARKLLEARADPNALNEDRRSPLSIAVEMKNEGMVSLLLEYKAVCMPTDEIGLGKIVRNIEYKTGT